MTGFPKFLCYQFFFLITICSHCFQYVFIFSVWVSILSNSNQLHIATCLENERGSLKLVHFETVRLNRGPQNKLLQKFNVQPFHLFSWYHLKVRMTYYNNSTNKFCLYMKHFHCLYNTLRVTETGHSRIYAIVTTKKFENLWYPLPPTPTLHTLSILPITCRLTSIKPINHN